MTSGLLVIGVENRQGNSNEEFEQVKELTRMFDNIEAHGLHVRTFRTDCGSSIRELVENSPCARKRSTSVPATVPNAGGCMNSARNRDTRR